MDSMNATQTRRWFTLASAGVVEVISGCADHLLDGPGLDRWSLRDLIGHTCRAYQTVEDYLAAAAASASPGLPTLASPTAYLDAARATLADPEAVHARGVVAGRELGPRVTERVRELAAEVAALLARTPDHAPVLTPVGAMSLDDYLPTRAFELTVHGLDLARASDQSPPAALRDAARAALRLTADLAGPDDVIPLLLSVTGRASLPVGFTVL